MDSIIIYVPHTLYLPDEDIDIEKVKEAIEKEFEDNPPSDRMIHVEDSEGNVLLSEWLQIGEIVHGNKAMLAIGYED